MRLPVLPARLAQIDVLKGVAILAVLALHSCTPEQLHDTGARFTIGQAVPVFVVIMGLNATASLWRRPARLAGAYTRRYVLTRLDRLYVPFLAVFAVSALIAAAQGTLTARGVLGGLVVGVLPQSGPGNYYVTLVFEFAVVFPALYVAFRRWPRATIAGCFAAGAAVELAAPHVSLLTRSAYVYEAEILRFLPMIALGMVLADRMLTGRPAPRWLIPAAALSVAYLVVVTVNRDAILLSDPALREFGQTFLGAFYPALIVAVGLRYLPRAAHGVLRPLQTVGVCSYEVFLVQIVWFALVDAQHPELFPVSVVVCGAVGWALHRALRRVPRLATT